MSSNDTELQSLGKGVFFEALADGVCSSSGNIPSSTKSPQGSDARHSISKGVLWATARLTKRRLSRSDSTASVSSKESSPVATLTRGAKVARSCRLRARLSRQNLVGDNFQNVLDSSLISLYDMIHNDHVFRTELISCLLMNHVDQGHLKVRFILAVSDYLTEADHSHKARKGSKILSLFTRSQSSFHIRSFRSAVKLPELEKYRLQMLQELLDVAVVRDLLNERMIPISTC